MTERLTALLREEALDLPVPAAPAATILRDGRAQRRRRTVATALGSVAVAAVIGGTAALGAGVLGGDEPGREPSVALAPASPILPGWAVGQGSTVILGSGQEVDVAGTVKSVYYTSAGVLARTGADASTDAADSAYSLIDLDGKVTDFSLDLGDRVPGTDPTLPYLAYGARGDDGGWKVVLRDVRDGSVATEIPIDGAFTWGGWSGPPVSLSGDHVFVGMDEATLDVDWRTGHVAASDVLPPSTMPTVHGGHEVVGAYGQAKQVVDAVTGEVLLRIDPTEDLLVLSPDGRYAAQRSFAVCEEDGSCTLERPSVEVYDLTDGSQVSVPVPGGGIGWTPTGDLLVVDGETVEVCDADTGDCRTTPLEIDLADLRLGGSIYEA